MTACRKISEPRKSSRVYRKRAHEWRGSGRWARGGARVVDGWSTRLESTDGRQHSVRSVI
jgi:hypothetical protein